MPAQRETSEAANPTLCDFLKDLFHSEQFFAQLLPLDIKPNVAVNEAQVFRVIPGDVGAASFKIIVKKQLNESSKFFVRYGAGWTQGTTFVRKLAADQKKRLSLKPKPLLPPATELYYSPKKTHESRRTLQEKTVILQSLNSLDFFDILTLTVRAQRTRLRLHMSNSLPISLL